MQKIMHIYLESFSEEIKFVSLSEELINFILYSSTSHGRKRAYWSALMILVSSLKLA